MRISILQDVIDVIRGKGVLPRKNKKKIIDSYSVPYKPPVNSYQKLICLTGFGHSGSGALLDYFSEFKNTTVLGFHDPDSSGFKNVNSLSGEIDFIRCVGGVFDLEYQFERGGYFNEDHAVKLFLHLTEYFYRLGGIFNDEFWRLTNNFITSIVDYKIPTSHGFDGQYMFEFITQREKFKNLSSPLCIDYPIENRCLYSLKKMTIDDYQKIAKQYIHEFLSSIESKEYLVLDQVMTTSKAEIERKAKYFNEFKLICSYRDPRDVYMTGILKNEQWIPKDPEHFIKWYFDRGVESYAKETHSNKLDIRFEDLILDYKKTTKKINEFVGLEEKDHNMLNKFLIPENSKKNIGIYKNCEDKKAIEYIEKQLKEYCYTERGL